MTAASILILALSIPPPAAASGSAREAALLSISGGLHPEALHAALAAWDALWAAGEVRRPVLCVIDYALPSTAKRMWVYDLSSDRLLLNDLVAHGKNSGDDLAVTFSNDDGSLMSSLGAFVTEGAYDGRNGYSLRLRGIEPSVNDNAEARAIVMHGARYVDDAVSKKLGRLGRSFGCPAVRPAIARELIDEIKDGGVIYAWHPSIVTAP